MKFKVLLVVITLFVVADSGCQKHNATYSAPSMEEKVQMDLRRMDEVLTMNREDLEHEAVNLTSELQRRASPKWRDVIKGMSDDDLRYSILYSLSRDSVRASKKYEDFKNSQKK
jgi:hypothetical protein